MYLVGDGNGGIGSDWTGYELVRVVNSDLEGALEGSLVGKGVGWDVGLWDCDLVGAFVGSLVGEIVG